MFDNMKAKAKDLVNDPIVRDAAKAAVVNLAVTIALGTAVRLVAYGAGKAADAIFNSTSGINEIPEQN